MRTFKIFGRQLPVVLKDQKINYTLLMQLARQNLCGNHEYILYTKNLWVIRVYCQRLFSLRNYLESKYGLLIYKMNGGDLICLHFLKFERENFLCIR